MIIIECVGVDVRIYALGRGGVNTREFDASRVDIEVGMDVGPAPAGLVVRVDAETGTATICPIRKDMPIAWPARVRAGEQPRSLLIEIECPPETPTRQLPSTERAVS